MAPISLIDAFNDCIERLHAGQSIDDCLRAYPDYAARLRPMLETGIAVRRAQPPVSAAAKARVQARLMQAVDTLPPARPHRFTTSRERLLAAAAVLLVIAGIVALLRLEPNRDGLRTVPISTPTLALTQSATPSDTPEPSITPSPTASLTPSPTPSQSPTPTLSPTPSCVPTRPSGWVTYTVVPGDTLTAVAQAHNTSTQRLIDANCLILSTVLTPGTTLFVPPPPVPTPTQLPLPFTDDADDLPGDDAGDDNTDNSGSNSSDGSSDDNSGPGSSDSDDHNDDTDGDDHSGSDSNDDHGGGDD